MSDANLTTLLESILQQLVEVRSDVGSIRAAVSTIQTRQSAIEQQLTDHISVESPAKTSWLSSIKYLAPALSIVFLAGMNTSEKLRPVPVPTKIKADTVIYDSRKHQEELLKAALGKLGEP